MANAAGTGASLSSTKRSRFSNKMGGASAVIKGEARAGVKGGGIREDFGGSARFVVLMGFSSLLALLGDCRKLVIWVWTCSFRGGGERKEMTEEEEDEKDRGNGVRMAFGVRMCFCGAGCRLEG